MFIHALNGRNTLDVWEHIFPSFVLGAHAPASQLSFGFQILGVTPYPKLQFGEKEVGQQDQTLTNDAKGDGWRLECSGIEFAALSIWLCSLFLVAAGGA